MEPISIQYRITEPEFMRACNAHWSARRIGTQSNIILGAVAVALGLALLAFIFWLAVLVAVAGALLLIVVYVRAFLSRRAYRETKKYHDDTSVIINDDLIHVENADGKSDLKWNFFTWYLETPDYVLLYTTKRNFSVIPNKAFPDSQSVNQFLDAIKEKLTRIK